MRRTILFIISIESIILAIAYSQYIYTLDIIQACARYSGRFSLLIFSIIFLTSKKPGNLGERILQKPYHAFAFTHGIHLIVILIYITLSERELIPIRILGGFIGYIFLFTMPYWWEQHRIEKLSKKSFQVIEMFFLYYIWLMFFLFYLPRVTGKITDIQGNYAQYVILLSWMSLLLGMKVISLFSALRKV